jgi:hypothetical protein
MSGARHQNPSEHGIEEARNIADRQVRQMTLRMDDLLDVARNQPRKNGVAKEG